MSNETATRGTPGATTRLDNWDVAGNYVERMMDNAPFLTANAEDTLVVAGPARWNADVGNIPFLEALLPIGMVQNMQFNQNKPNSPVPSIGTSRQAYLSGRSQNSYSIGRMFLNGRNLLRVLMAQAIAADIAVDKDLLVSPVPPDIEDGEHKVKDGVKYPFFANLDSELFAMPFGLGVLFKDKAERLLGGVYLELCTINSWGLQFTAGQSAIMEGTNGLFDRLVPWLPSEYGTNKNVFRGQDKLSKIEELLAPANGEANSFGVPEVPQ